MLGRRVESLNVYVVTVLIGAHGLFEVFPPANLQPFLAYETKPWRKQQRSVLHHGCQFVRGDPLNVVNFIRVWFNGEFRLVLDAEKEYVVDLVLSPRAK